jgi:Holliday junction resolvase RusA-like endonuclease
MTAPTLFDLAADLPAELKRRPAVAAPERASDLPVVPATSGTLLPAGDSIHDNARINLLLGAIAPGSTGARTLTIPGTPATKTRARHGKHRTYKTKEDVAAEERTAGYLRKTFARPMTGNVAIACVFFRHDMKLIDTDNMLKHVCDAANGIVYIDDSQTTAVYGITEYDPTNPRTVIVVAHHRSSMVRGTDDVSTCERCSAVFLTNGRKYCTDACRWPNRAVTS